ncbi:MAG: HD domain-containing protein [Spirochaetaceae bacterium]|jgi:uncharacterized protein|nr:HD domain-containing protein [Spirochaetaceae bacterium]
MQNQELFNEYAKEIINNKIFKECKKIFSHGSVSIYEHSIAVAKKAFALAEKNAGVDKKCVVRAALLHDFFLYEWHIPGVRYLVHGWAHPAIAAKKAREVFNITDKEYSCIKTHMWPWTLFTPPRCREGWIISISDKIIALKETALRRGNRGRLRDPLASQNRLEGRGAFTEA